MDFISYFLSILGNNELFIIPNWCRSGIMFQDYFTVARSLIDICNLKIVANLTAISQNPVIAIIRVNIEHSYNLP